MRGAERVAASHILDGDVDSAVDRFGRGTLTGREQQIIQLVLRGHNTESAANRLGIAFHTAKGHRVSAYRKLGVNSQGELFCAFLRTIGLQRYE